MAYGQMPVEKTSKPYAAKKKGLCALNGDTIDKGEMIVSDDAGEVAHLQCAKDRNIKIGKK